MKKKIGPALLMLAVMGSAVAIGQEKKGAEPKLFEEAFYPLKEGHRWTYQVTDNNAKEPRTKKTQVAATVTQRETYLIKTQDKLIGNDIQQPYTGFTLQVAGGGKILEEAIIVKEDGVYRLSGAGKSITPPLLFLKKNSAKGVSWKVDSQSENALLKGQFKVDEETVQVPAGSFKAILVRTEGFQVGGQKMVLETWYASGVGMVKQHVKVGQHDVTLELEKFEAAK